MNGGSRFLATAAVLALAGCGGSDAKLEIRSTPTPLSATSKPVPHRIAEAHGHLALGNVALAIESFRKALREQPDSVDAMVGLADSYDRMTRFDLSRRYYESALAIVPADTRVLTAFARSLEAQGRSVEAAEVRNEIRVRSAAAAPPAPVIQALAPKQMLAQALPVVAGPSVTIKLPPARPVATVAAKRPAEPKARATTPPARPEPKLAAAVLPPPPAPVAAAPAPAEPIAVAKKTEPMNVPAPVVVARKPVEAKPIAPPPPPAPVAVAARPEEPKAAISPPPPPPPVAVAIKPVEAKPIAPPPPAAPVLVASKPVAPKAAPAPTPAAAPAAPVAVARKPVELAAAPSPPPPAPPVMESAEAPAARLLPAPTPVALAQQAPLAPLPEAPAGQRLERLSLGEVALVTTGRPQWRALVVSKTAQSTTMRFVPLRKTAARPVRIRLLNAARYEGLAARSRRLLAQRGWRQLAIGNARRVRQSSLVLYPAHQRALAKRLAAQFGIALAKNPSGTDLVVLLGRDAARRNPVRRG